MTVSTDPMRLPKKKRAIHDFMRDHYRTHGQFPSRRAIAAGLGRAPNGYISRAVADLRERGHLRVIERARR